MTFPPADRASTRARNAPWVSVIWRSGAEMLALGAVVPESPTPAALSSRHSWLRREWRELECRLHSLTAMMGASIKDFLVTVTVLASLACGGPQVAHQSPVSSQSASSAQAATTIAPRVSINAAMVALVDHAGHQLWNAEREGMAPKSDEDWRTIEEHATQLAAIAPVLMIGGTGPTDAVWVKAPPWRTHVQSLSDAAGDAIAAARAQNLDRLVAANGRLVESCEACHKEFKPAAPTEGIVHAHAH